MFGVFKKKEETIYKRICDEITQNGSITPQFQLTKIKDGELQFASGAADGSLMYHFLGSNSSDEYGVLSKAIQQFLVSGNKKEIKKIVDHLELENHRAISAAASLLEDIVSYSELVNTHIERYAFLGHYLMTEAVSVETVKFGIVLSEPLIGPYGQKEIDVLKTLGKHEEFTYFALTSLKNKLEPTHFNTLCIEYAQQSKGWGKVHSITLLENPNEAEQAWIVRNGCLEEGLDMYLGHECLDKGNVRSLLESDSHLEEDVIKGITGIFQQLLAEHSPLIGLEIVADDLKLIADYSKHLKQREAWTDEQLSVCQKMCKYVERNYPEVEEGQHVLKNLQGIVAHPE